MVVDVVTVLHELLQGVLYVLDLVAGRRGACGGKGGGMRKGNKIPLLNGGTF